MSNEPTATPANDPIKPLHYRVGGIQAIHVIRAWGLCFSLGNCVKYIQRHKHKGTPLEDLKKARWYLDEAISHLEREQKEQNVSS